MLQTEVAQLEAEISESDDTTWSGITLLAGGFSTGATFQIGPRDTDTIQISLSAIDATAALADGGLLLNSQFCINTSSCTIISRILDNAISNHIRRQSKIWCNNE